MTYLTTLLATEAITESLTTPTGVLAYEATQAPIPDEIDMRNIDGSVTTKCETSGHRLSSCHDVFGQIVSYVALCTPKQPWTQEIEKAYKEIAPLIHVSRTWHNAVKSSLLRMAMFKNIIQKPGMDAFFLSLARFGISPSVGFNLDGLRSIADCAINFQQFTQPGRPEHIHLQITEKFSKGCENDFEALLTMARQLHLPLVIDCPPRFLNEAWKVQLLKDYSEQPNVIWIQRQIHVTEDGRGLWTDSKPGPQTREGAGGRARRSLLDTFEAASIEGTSADSIRS